MRKKTTLFTNNVVTSRNIWYIFRNRGRKMDNGEQDFRIDIDKVLRDKLGSKAKFVPGFVVKWLKDIVHQDFINNYIARDGKGLIGMDFLDGCLNYLQNEIRVQTNIDGVLSEGLDALPSNEGGRWFTIVSNHPLGGQDGLALGSIVCHKWDSKMVYLVNDLLMNFKGLVPLCVPINKTGKQARNFPQMVEAAFRSERNVVMFPAGLCSRKGDDGTIRDLPWKKTFITKSIETHRDVIPVHFSGHNSDRFYNIARFCKKCHLKVNLAMLYLGDEMYKNAGKTFTVTFGQPIPWQTFTDHSKTPAEWAAWVQNKVYELNKE